MNDVINDMGHLRNDLIWHADDAIHIKNVMNVRLNDLVPVIHGLDRVVQ